jgi:hypothetical protein
MVPDNSSVMFTGLVSRFFAVCALQEVQLYDVDRQRWRRALQAGAEIDGLTMVGPQLLLAAAGPEVLLWLRARLVHRFQSAFAAAAAACRALQVPPSPCTYHCPSPPAACCLCCVASICPVISFTY